MVMNEAANAERKPSHALRAGPVVHVVPTPKYGQGRVTPDLRRCFSPCERATKPTMYYDHGRTVQLNIQRLPTPAAPRDFRTTILLGGHSSFREMAEERGRPPPAHVPPAKKPMHAWNTGIDPAEVARKKEEQQRYEVEFEIASRREQLLQRQREEHANRQNHVSLQSAPSTVEGVDADGGQSFDELLQSERRPTVPVVRALTPAQQTRRTLRSFAERAKTPDLSFDALYNRPPTNFSVHHEKSGKRDEYEEELDGHVPPSRASAPRASRERYTPVETPAVLDPNNLNTAVSLQTEVEEFERRRAEAEEEVAQYSPEIQTIIHATQIPPPPKLILMLFRFGNVRNLPITQKLRQIGYPILHEQFSSLSERGTITRQNFLTVVKRYASSSGEVNDALKIINCFDKSAMGDVELNPFLLGLQILLHSASAGDTLKYCFSLMDTNNRVPRYVTRFEVQSLLSSALNIRKEKLAAQSRSGARSEDDEEEGDREFDVMARAIHDLMEESWRYDYMGRIGLKEFLKLLEEKALGYKATMWDAQSPRGSKRPAVLLQSMGLGNNWQQQPCVAAAHRMSSKKILLSSLQFLPTNSLKDPHRITSPPTAGDGSGLSFSLRATRAGSIRNVGR